MIKRFLILPTLASSLLGGALHVTSHAYIKAENYAKAKALSFYEQSVIMLAEDLGLEKPPPKLPDATRESIIEREAKINKVSVALVHAIIEQESKNNRFAVSSAGAIGLMQVMPANASMCGYDHPSLLYDEENNIVCGVRILKNALRNQGGNVIMALKEYNAGASRIDKTDENKKYPHLVLAKLK